VMFVDAAAEPFEETAAAGLLADFFFWAITNRQSVAYILGAGQGASIVD